MAVSGVTHTRLKAVFSKFSQFTFDHYDVLGMDLWAMVVNGYIGGLWYSTEIVSVINYTVLFGDMFLEDQDEAR